MVTKKIPLAFCQINCINFSFDSRGQLNLPQDITLVKVTAGQKTPPRQKIQGADPEALTERAIFISGGPCLSLKDYQGFPPPLGASRPLPQPFENRFYLLAEFPPPGKRFPDHHQWKLQKVLLGREHGQRRVGIPQLFFLPPWTPSKSDTAIAKN